MKHRGKHAAAALLALALVVGAVPANVGTGGTAIVADAANLTDEYVWIDTLQKGDVLTSSVGSLVGWYTITLQADTFIGLMGSVSTDNETLDLSSEYPLENGTFVNSNNNASPYCNGVTADSWRVAAIDHDDKTMTLEGYAKPETDPVAMTGGRVGYIRYNTTAKQLVTAKIDADQCYQVVSTDRKWENGSWYVVTGDTVFEQRIKIEGAVHLILEDGVTLTAKQGIEVNGDATLDIHAQSEGENAGKLFAGTTNGSDSTMPRAQDIAAIGGGSFSTNGDINIHGGIINANAHSGAAAIGGGQYTACGTINIYGGEVSASLYSAASSASIGGGYLGKGGTVNVLGGTVTAYDQNQESVPETWNIAEGAAIMAGESESAAVKVETVGSEYYVHIEAPTHLLTSLDDGVYKQTAEKDGKYYTRFVFVQPKSELEGKSKAVFTAHYDNKDYPKETDIYYTGVTTNGVTYTPDSEDSVMLVVTIQSSADISADLTCDVTFE